MIFVGILLSKYDFPITTTFKEYYVASFTNFYKNIGVFLAFAFIVSLMGFLNVTFVYGLSFLLVVESIYLAKAILANMRK